MKGDTMNTTIINPAPGSVMEPIRADLYERFIAFIDRPGKTAATYLINLRQFAAWAAYRGIQAPQRADIIAYRDYLIHEHEAVKMDPCSPAGWTYRTDRAGRPLKITCSPSTAAQYLRTVCMFFRWTAAEGIYPNVADNIHAPKISNDNHKKEALPAAAVCRVAAVIDNAAAEKVAAADLARKDTAGRHQRATEQGQRLHAMYLLAVTAGLRTVELSRANVADLETIDGVTYLYIHGKGRSQADQKKALAADVAAAVREYLLTRSDGSPASSPLFVSTGNRSGGRRIASTTISKMIKQALQVAGYDSKRLTAHSLRHTAGMAAMTATNKNVYLTQQYMRHASPATTEIYLHCDNTRDELRTAEQIMNYYHAAVLPGAAV